MDHYYKFVEGWFFHAGLFGYLIDIAPKGSTFVEVGSWKGKSASFMGVEMIKADKGLELICVDTFKGSDEEAHHKDPDIINGTLFERFLANTKPIAEVIEVHPVDSLTASRFIENEMAWCVYLDAAHDYDSVKADIAAWWPKVEPGGWLVGDDWIWDGVRKAVEEAFEGQTIEVVGDYPAWAIQKRAEHGESHSVDENGERSEA